MDGCRLCGKEKPLRGWFVPVAGGNSPPVLCADCAARLPNIANEAERQEFVCELFQQTKAWSQMAEAIALLEGEIVGLANQQHDHERRMKKAGETVEAFLERRWQ